MTIHLPLGWCRAELQELFIHPKQAIVDGPFGSNLKASEYQESGVPIIRLQNVDRSKFVRKNVKFISQKKAEQLKRHDFREGDIVITKLGNPLGKACIVPEGFGPGVIVADIVRSRTERDDISMAYLVNCINSPHIANQLKSKTKGTTRPRVNLDHIRSLNIPLPPVAEQHRIVAKIEELFSDLDAGIAALEKAKAQLKRYRQSVLKAAFEGKLTAEWREAHLDELEPAAELLERIREERKKTLGKKYREPPPVDTTELPELPEGWEWATIDHVSNVVRGASPRPAGNPKHFGGSIPWITVGHLTADDSPYLDSVDTFVTEEGRKKSRYIPPDTLLITNSGATLGVPKITRIGGCINDGSVAMLDIDYPSKLFVYFYLKTLTHRLRNINQGAAQPNLNTTIIRRIAVPFAPPKEQEYLLQQIQERLSVAEYTERVLDESLQQATRLRQSVLKRAFEGRLVPQDPNDEPAEKLLERIKAEKAKLEGNKPKKRRSSRKKKAEMIDAELDI